MAEDARKTADGWDTNAMMGLKPGEKADVGALSKSIKGLGVEDDPTLWGLPGHMTEEEVDVFFKFRDEVEKRGGDFRDTVYCFGEEEGEAWAVARWLRARKFVYDDVVKMVEEATEVRQSAKDKDFYPNPVDALGVDSSIFFAQYPQVYSGFAKNGCPVFISKPGILNVDGMECITTLDGIIKFHWYIMMHDFANRLRAQKKKDPEHFKRFECVCILDLDKLTTAQLSRRALAIIKEQAAIDSVCFPETMSKMILVNSPSFFSASWRLIKGWLDPRTASKIEVVSNRAAGEKRLLEFIDEAQLPSDYGGKGPDTNETIMESFEGHADRMDTKMLYVRGSCSEIVEIPQGKNLEVTVFTRSIAGAKFSLVDPDSKKALVPETEVKHGGTTDTNEIPTSVVLNKEKHIDGPRTVKMKVYSNASRFSTQNFLVVVSFYKHKN